jgi:hypothetical protein
MRLAMKPAMGMHQGTVVVAGGGGGQWAEAFRRAATGGCGRMIMDPLPHPPDIRSPRHPHPLVEDLEVGQWHSGRWAWELPLIKVVRW